MRGKSRTDNPEMTKRNRGTKKTTKKTTNQNNSTTHPIDDDVVSHSFTEERKNDFLDRSDEEQ